MKSQLLKDLLSGKTSVDSSKPENISSYTFTVKSKSAFGETEKTFVLEAESSKEAKILLEERLKKESDKIVGFEVVSIEESAELINEDFGNLKGIPVDIAKRLVTWFNVGQNSKVEEMAITSIDGFNSKVKAWAAAKAKEAGKEYANVAVYFKTEKGQDAYITQNSPQKWNFYSRSEKHGGLDRHGEVKPSGLNIQLPQKIVLISPDYARIQKRTERFTNQQTNDPLAAKKPFSDSDAGSTFDYESGMKVISKYYDEIAVQLKRIQQNSIDKLMNDKDVYSYKTKLANLTKVLDSSAWYATKPSKTGNDRMTANDLKRAIQELKKIIENLKKM